jgi:hypothetical protein
VGTTEFRKKAFIGQNALQVAFSADEGFFHFRYRSSGER